MRKFLVAYRFRDSEVVRGKNIHAMTISEARSKVRREFRSNGTEAIVIDYPCMVLDKDIDDNEDTHLHDLHRMADDGCPHYA